MFDNRILGSGDFVEAVLKGVDEPKPAKISRQEVINEVKRITGVGYEELSGKSRERRIVKGRAVYCYLRRERSCASGAELTRILQLKDSPGGQLFCPVIANHWAKELGCPALLRSTAILERIFLF
ncbi:MAG: hypothetical protein ABIG11_07985, partial [bacterium]